MLLDGLLTRRCVSLQIIDPGGRALSTWHLVIGSCVGVERASSGQRAGDGRAMSGAKCIKSVYILSTVMTYEAHFYFT
jgi:hypothetical protein